MRARKLNRANVKERISMFDKRLFSLAPGVGRLVAAKVLCQWVGLLANVVFVVTVVVMLSPALAWWNRRSTPCSPWVIVA